MKIKTKDANRTDIVYRNTMLVLGIITFLLFFLSLIAAIEFPEAFGFIALLMIGFAIAFFIIRSVYNFRKTFKADRKK